MACGLQKRSGQQFQTSTIQKWQNPRWDVSSLYHIHAFYNPKCQYVSFFFSCKLVRIYKTHTLEKKQSVFSSLLSDYKAYKSYKTRFITWNKYKIVCQYDKWKSRLWAVVCRVKAPVETWATIRPLIPVSIPDCRSGRRGSMDVINNWLAVVCFPPSVFLSPPRANRSLSTSQSDHGFHSVKDKCHY